MEKTKAQPSILINSNQGFNRTSHIPSEHLITWLILCVQSNWPLTCKRNCSFCLLENHTFSNAIFFSFQNRHIEKFLTSFNYLPKVTKIKEKLHKNCIKVFWIRPWWAWILPDREWPWPKQWLRQQRLHESWVEFLLTTNNNFRSKAMKWLIAEARTIQVRVDLQNPSSKLPIVHKTLNKLKHFCAAFQF